MIFCVLGGRGVLERAAGEILETGPFAAIKVEVFQLAGYSLGSTGIVADCALLTLKIFFW